MIEIILTCIVFILKYIICPLIVIIGATIISLIIAKYKLIDEWLNKSHKPGFWTNLISIHEDELIDIQKNIMVDHRTNSSERNPNKYRYHRFYILLYAIKTFYK